MKVELFPFQKRALADIRMKTSEAMGSYHRTHAPQVVSFTAPTGAGKTIIMASLIESIFFGDENYAEQPNAIIVWLSDSPQLNEQSKLKIDSKADKIRLSQCVTVSEDSFDKETFENGHIYFLNTQKLSTSSKLTKNGDGRTYTIWQTLANTVRHKSDRLYFIIDEAHRGMQGRDASKATTIMQKFIKGSDTDKIPPMPVVIGMSATTQRFNALVEGTSSTIHKAVVTADEVRASGLLKDRIVITYPEEDSVNNDMAILQAAADDWKQKWEHWTQYCFEQHYAYVNPIMIVQVLNGSGSKLTDTDLDDCLRKIEERTGFKFEPSQVVHTFGQTTSAIQVNGLDVRYEEPSRIADDRNIRIVFFKENLSTGWDCPRAETMMSFKHASDATYIAQLLGRMVRTPMQMHIQVDDVLNDVHLFLPYFNEDTVKDVVEALQSSEGGEIPTDIYGETTSGRKFETLTVKPKKKSGPTPVQGQLTMDAYNTAHVVNLTDLGKQLIAWHSQRPTISYSETKIFDKYFDQLFHRDYAPENVQALNAMFAAVYEKWGKENPMGLNETLLAMKAYAPYHQLFAISVILCEINKMNDSVPSPSVALRKMTESGLLDYIVEMAGNCLNMAMETAQDTVAGDTGKLFVPQNWIKSKASLKDIRVAVKQMVASLKMLPDGKKVLARLNEGLAMNKEDFEARWTAD